MPFDESQINQLVDRAYRSIIEHGHYTPTEDHDSEFDTLARFGFETSREKVTFGETIQLLEVNKILEDLPPEISSWIHRIEIFPSIGSTNDVLMNDSRNRSIDRTVVLAEVQTAGRGRRGRTWESPFGRNIALSIGIQLDLSPVSAGSVSLVVGVAVAEALKSLGVKGVQLKWPNDILIHTAKAGGILTELVSAKRPVDLIIGVGINVGGASYIRTHVDYPIADVCDQIQTPIRNRVASTLIHKIVESCFEYEKRGFFDFRRSWMDLDAYKGRSVKLSTPSETFEGVDIGIGDNGELLIRDASQNVRSFVGGEISLREA